jgi:hypothetical protein
MPDNYGGGGFGQYLPALSHLLGEVESPTNTQGAMNPQFGGSPEQLMAILQHPQTQQLMQQLGIHFDPSKMRQSPFLPNSFMQAHPQMGGAISGAMANAAATPEAPMVSGVGSGIQRAMQGMMGGPELQRQYQVRQMMAPMQAMGSMIPAQEFQRKQQLLQVIQQMEADRRAQGARQEQIQGQEPRIHPVQGGYVSEQYQQGAPAGGQQGMDLQQDGQGRQFQDPMGGGQRQMPGYGLTPQQQAGWQEQFHGTDPALLAAQSAAKNPQNVAKAGQINADVAAGGPGAKVDETKSKAEKNRADAGYSNRDKPGGGRGGSNKDYSKNYDAIEKDITPKIQVLQRAQQAAKTPEEKAAYQQQIDALNENRETRKGNIDKQRGDPGASKRGLVSPGAGQQQAPIQAPGGAKANAPKSSNDINSHPEMQGAPAGYYKDNEKGGTFYWDGKQVGQGPAPQQRQ